jgi:mannose-6-phosphate isomerase-like protein (cupin superfamily)
MKRRSILTSAAAISISALCPPVQAESPQRGIRVAAGQDRLNAPTPLGGTRSIDWKVSAADSNGGWSALESQWRRKGGPPLHLHRDQDEWFYVIKSEFVMQVGDESFHLTAGDSIFMPRKVPHTFAHVGDGDGRLVATYQPAGDMEAFFRIQSKFTGSESQGELQRIYKAHGLELIGPPLPV